ncbi:hypothetical protein FS935_00865 [Metabacillus litoralis]|uniref:DUF3221 domain-containing protein n=1 Tax=Metabacillus litoralis TaxID=152268 RepID=A0A5C6W5V0_9BACI|nr:hypothetical protein [Metabacillus litoralis]TXC92784.1 hypothetical protein FS935_00865 [Metabacillus litoralis]
MKKITLILTVLSVLILSACGKNVEFGVKGHILEIEDSTSSIVVGTGNGDPTATYPAYTIFVTKNTSFSGDVQQFSDLKVAQRVQISIEGEKEIDKVEGDIVAADISVD